MQSSSKTDAVVVAAAAAIACGLIARLAFLAADPTYPFWSGWVSDEGRWLQTARDVVLFGDPSLDTYLERTHLLLAPVYQAVSAAVFWMFGVGSVRARMVSVASGLGILLVTWLFLRDRLPARVTWATLALLAVQPDLVYFSRVAIPEMTALFFEVCAFVLLVGGPRTPRKAFFAGIATAIGLGVKGTTAPVVLAFALIALVLHRPTDLGSRLARLAAFLTAIVLPGAGFLILVGLRYSAWGGLGDLVYFVQLDSVYGILETLFRGGWTTRVNLMLMTAWGLGLLSLIRGFPEGTAREIFIGASAWVAAVVVPWALLLYFPERYLMHVHLPLILVCASGYTLLAGDGGASLDAALGKIDGVRRTVLATCLVVPAAALTAPLLLFMIDVVGPTLDNLRFRLGAIAGLSIVMGLVLRSRWRARWVSGIGLGYPLAAGALWALGGATGWVPSSFWSIDGARTGLAWVVILGCATAAAAVGSRAGRGPSGPRALGFVGAFAGVIAVLWVGQGAARLLDRHYVQRDVAAYLVETYPASELVGTRGASSLLIGTPFAYRELYPGDVWPDLVVVYLSDQDAGSLEDHELVREFDLDVGAGFTDTYRDRHVIQIYERR